MQSRVYNKTRSARNTRKVLKRKTRKNKRKSVIRKKSHKRSNHSRIGVKGGGDKRDRNGFVLDDNQRIFTKPKQQKTKPTSLSEVLHIVFPDENIQDHQPVDNTIPPILPYYILDSITDPENIEKLVQDKYLIPVKKYNIDNKNGLLSYVDENLHDIFVSIPVENIPPIIVSIENTNHNNNFIVNNIQDYGDIEGESLICKFTDMRPFTYQALNSNTMHIRIAIPVRLGGNAWYPMQMIYIDVVGTGMPHELQGSVGTTTYADVDGDATDEEDEYVNTPAMYTFGTDDEVPIQILGVNTGINSLAEFNTFNINAPPTDTFLPTREHLVLALVELNKNVMVEKLNNIILTPYAIYRLFYQVSKPSINYIENLIVLNNEEDE